MQDTGSLGLVRWDDPEGWYGEGGGRGIQDGEHVYTRGRFMSMYGHVLVEAQSLLHPRQVIGITVPEDLQLVHRLLLFFFDCQCHTMPP